MVRGISTAMYNMLVIRVCNDKINLGRSIYLDIENFIKGQIVDACKLKEFADDNFKCDKNGGKFSKMIENTV